MLVFVNFLKYRFLYRYRKPNKKLNNIACMLLYRTLNCQNNFDFKWLVISDGMNAPNLGRCGQKTINIL